MNLQTTFYFPFKIDLRAYQSLQTVQQIKQFYQMLIHTDQYRNKRIKGKISFHKDKSKPEDDSFKKVRIFFTCCKVKKRHPFFLYIKSQLTGIYELQQCLAQHDHGSILTFPNNNFTSEKPSSIIPSNQKHVNSNYRQKSQIELKILDISNDYDCLQSLKMKNIYLHPKQIQTFIQWRLYDIPSMKELVQMQKFQRKIKQIPNEKSKFQKDKKELENQGYVQYRFPLQKQLNQIKLFDTVDQMIQTLQRLLGLSHHRQKKIQFHITVSRYSEVEVSFPCCNINYIRPFISYKNTKRSHYQLDSCNLVHYHKPNVIVEQKLITQELEKQQTNHMNKFQYSVKPAKQSQKEQKS